MKEGYVLATNGEITKEIPEAALKAFGKNWSRVSDNTKVITSKSRGTDIVKETVEEPKETVEKVHHKTAIANVKAMTSVEEIEAYAEADGRASVEKVAKLRIQEIKEDEKG